MAVRLNKKSRFELVHEANLLYTLTLFLIIVLNCLVMKYQLMPFALFAKEIIFVAVILMVIRIAHYLVDVKK